MKVFITERATETKKCGGCNWETSIFYGVAKTKECAREIYKNVHTEEERQEYGLGLCSDCITQFLVNTQPTV